VATKRWKEIKNLSKDELTTKVRETESELFKTKMQHATGQLGNTSTIWKLRKDIARMKTLQTQLLAGKAPQTDTAVVAAKATAKTAAKTKTAKATR
jgi:large subunit ribosomal protein L29